MDRIEGVLKAVVTKLSCVDLSIPVQGNPGPVTN